MTDILDAADDLKQRMKDKGRWPPKRAPIPYDPACLELARHFSQDGELTETELDALAGDLQDTVETFFDWKRGRCPKSDDGEHEFVVGVEIGGERDEQRTVEKCHKCGEYR